MSRLSELSAISIAESFIPQGASNTRQVLKKYEDRHPSLVWPSTSEDQLFVLAPWLAFPWKRSAEQKELIIALADATHKDGRQLILDLGPGKTRTPFEAAQRYSGTTILALDLNDPPQYVDMGELAPLQEGSLIVSIPASFLGLEGIGANIVHWMAPEEARLFYTIKHLDNLLAPGGQFVAVMVRNYQETDISIADLFQRELELEYQIIQEELSYEEIQDKYGFSHTNYSRSFWGIVSVIEGVKPLD